MSEPAREEASVRETAVTAGALFALALAVRLVYIDQGFWYDELFSLMNFFRADWITLLTRMPDPNHHPLYSLLGKACITVFGEDEWSARLPALLAGCASVPALYLLGARFMSRMTGLIASTVMCFSFWHVYFSSDARGYSLVILLSIISWWAFSSLADEIKIRSAVFLVLANVMVMYTHLYSGALVGAEFIIAGLMSLRRGENNGKNWRVITGVCAVSLVLAFVLYLPMLGDLIEFSGTEGRVTNARELGGVFIFGLLESWSSGGGGLLRSIPALLFFFTGAIFWARRAPVNPGLWAASFLAGIAAPLLMDTFVYHRFYAFLMPGFYLFLGAGLDYFGSLAGSRKWVSILLALALSAMYVPGLVDLRTRGKQGLRESAQWINENEPGARVISIGLGQREFSYYYPGAILPGDKQPLDSGFLSGSVVVIVFSWSVNPGLMSYIDSLCGEPLIFGGAGYEVNDVILYKCMPRGDEKR